MKKMHFNLMAFVMIAAVLTGGCITLPGPTVTTAAGSVQEHDFTFDLNNPHNYLLYPAVGVAFTNVSRMLGGKHDYQPRLSTINALNNEFQIRSAQASRTPTEVITYRVNISGNDNKLVITFTDIEPFDSGLIIYNDAEIRAMRFDPSRIANQIKTEIERVLVSEAAYNTAKVAFLANNDFLSRALASVTGMMEEEFIKTVLGPGEVTFNARISNVQPNEAAEFSNFSTYVTASLTDSAGRIPFAYINFYTSDPAFARITPNTNMALTGTFVRMESTGAGRRFIMTK